MKPVKNNDYDLFPIKELKRGIRLISLLRGNSATFIGLEPCSGVGSGCMSKRLNLKVEEQTRAKQIVCWGRDNTLYWRIKEGG